MTQRNPLSAFNAIVSDYVLTYQMLVLRNKEFGHGALGIGHGDELR
ncbi:hypothetical protein [Nostoc sp.]